MLRLMGKKIMAILHQKICLTGPMLHATKSGFLIVRIKFYSVFQKGSRPSSTTFLPEMVLAGPHFWPNMFFAGPFSHVSS